MQNPAAIVGVVAALVAPPVIARRLGLGLFGPKSPVWQNVLFGVIWCVWIMLAILVFTAPFFFEYLPLVLVVFVLPAVVGGAILGLLTSLFYALRPRFGNKEKRSI